MNVGYFDLSGMIQLETLEKVHPFFDSQSRCRFDLVVCFLVLLMSVSGVSAQIGFANSDIHNQADAGVKKVAERSNIILINLDDADVDLFKDKLLDQYLPNIKRLANNGLRFTNCHVVTPLCGPSRACLLRGQYAHKTGIKTNVVSGPMNNGYSGAYTLFKEKGYEDENLGVWMHRAGYRTMMIGKYSHGRMNPVGIPGWDDLYICFGGNYYSTARYATRYPVKLRRNATGADEYRTVVEGDEAVRMITEHRKRISLSETGKAETGKLKSDEKSSRRDVVTDQPFFLYMAPLAPHLPAYNSKMLEEKYVDFAKDVRMEVTPDLNEADVSDKPKHLQIPKLSDASVESLHQEHRRRLITIKSIDDMVSKLFEGLKANGFDKNTYIFFTSDHGYQLGHNRMIAKKMPFNRSTIVPMFVIGPNVKPGKANHLMAHIDLVPTFLEIAGGKASTDLDGKSVLPLLSDPESVSPDDFRSELLIQNWEEKGQVGRYLNSSYASLRTSDQIYTEWSNGAREFYDLSKDPYQLENGITSLDSAEKARLSKQLHDLKQGTPQPIATIASPELISKNTIISGFAEDDDAVAKVNVQFFNPKQNTYWNGESWQADLASVVAELGYQDGLISTWNAKPDLAGFENEGRLQITATALDKQGNVSEQAKYECRVDAIDPLTKLLQPVSESVLESPVTISGECGDNQKMRGIELTLENRDNGKFWDGQNWTETKSTFFKRVLQKRWHRNVGLEPGKYRVTARALDQAGNYDATPDVAEFSVK
ncbi:MAG: sulfatase-like hydrolase/transferase [Mariniblastus sp.]